MAIKYGLVAGLITVICYALAYFIDIEVFLSPMFNWGTIIIYLVAMYKLGDHVVGLGLETFRDIVRPLFLCYLVANLIYYIFYYVMIKYVNPEIYTMQMDLMVDKLKELDLDETDMTFKLSHFILQYFQSAIGGFMIAASIAYTKKQS